MTHARVTAALLALLIGAFGCGLTVAQQEATRKFGWASITVGEFTMSELPRMRETTMVLNTASVSIGGTADPGDLDGPADPNTIPTRVLAAEALASYGRLLVALVEETQAQELQKAADEFVASAARASESDLSDAQLQAAGRIVTAIGRRIVEYEKSRALKAIVPEYRPVIDELCDLLRLDFLKTGLRLAQGLDVAAVRLQADADIVLADRRAPETQRAAAAEALRMADVARARTDIVYREAVQALDALKKANAQLVEALASDQFGIADVQAFAHEAQGLHAAAMALSGR